MALPKLMSPVPVSLTIVTVGAKMVYHATSCASVPLVRPPSVNPSLTSQIVVLLLPLEGVALTGGVELALVPKPLVADTS